MFVRYRRNKSKLQLSVVESHRLADGKIVQEHVASLGSIADPATPIDRLEFWQALHGRLGRLNNRIDGETAGKIMTAVHARVPMVTQDEQRALKLATAEEDARFARSLHDMHDDSVTGQRRLASNAQKAIANGEAEMAVLAKDAATANERAEKLRLGEDAPVKISRPLTQKEFMKQIGWTPADVREAKVLQELHLLGATEKFIAAKLDKKVDRAIARRILRELKAKG